MTGHPGCSTCGALGVPCPQHLEWRTKADSYAPWARTGTYRCAPCGRVHHADDTQPTRDCPACGADSLLYL